tara:strand:+ start:70 stop:927 length:858 start_codon:yes stop_codon:yes gene_type:complete
MNINKAKLRRIIRESIKKQVLIEGPIPFVDDFLKKTGLKKEEQPPEPSEIPIGENDLNVKTKEGFKNIKNFAGNFEVRPRKEIEAALATMYTLVMVGDVWPGNPLSSGDGSGSYDIFESLGKSYKPLTDVMDLYDNFKNCFRIGDSNTYSSYINPEKEFVIDVDFLSKIQAYDNFLKNDVMEEYGEFGFKQIYHLFHSPNSKMGPSMAPFLYEIITGLNPLGSTIESTMTATFSGDGIKQIRKDNQSHLLGYGKSKDPEMRGQSRAKAIVTRKVKNKPLDTFQNL